MIRTLIAVFVAAVIAAPAMAQTTQQAPAPSPDSNQIGELKAEIEKLQKRVDKYEREEAASVAAGACSNQLDAARFECDLAVLEKFPDTNAARDIRINLIEDAKKRRSASVPKFDRLPLPPVVTEPQQGMPNIPATPPRMPGSPQHDFGYYDQYVPEPSYGYSGPRSSCGTCGAPPVRPTCDMDNRPMPQLRPIRPAQPPQHRIKPRRCNYCR